MAYDLIILGGGPAGYLAAEHAGDAGLSVLLVEERSVGGVCLNEGCIPTKTFLHSAKLYDGAKTGGKYGVHTQDISINHAEVVDYKNKVVRTLVSGVKAGLKASKVTVKSAHGEIKGRSAEGYEVDAGGESFTGKQLLICTGSSTVVPPIPGLKEGLASGFVVTNRELLDMKEQPKTLAVIGGGVIGLEFCGYFSSIGTKVVVLEMLDHIAGANDAEIIKILQKDYEKKGIVFNLGAKVTEIKADGVCYEKDGKSEIVKADKVLLSIGRRANVKGIGLESIGVETYRGGIVTDEHMKTNQPGVYAAGDVNGKSMLAHTAYREADVAVNNILGKKDVMRYDAIPGVIYTNPEFASVGECEASAKEKNMDVAVVKLPMIYSGRYIAETDGGDGVVKLVIDKKRGVLVGAQALSPYASEFIVTAGTFIELQLNVETAKKIVFPHPTMVEIIREALYRYK